MYSSKRTRKREKENKIMVKLNAAAVFIVAIIMGSVLVMGGWIPLGHDDSETPSSVSKTEPTQEYYTVTFVDTQFTVPEQVVKAGKYAIQPSLPEMEGWSFIGWFTSSGSHWNFATNAVYQDTILIAKWQQNSYTGETQNPESDSATLTPSSPEKETGVQTPEPESQTQTVIQSTPSASEDDTESTTPTVDSEKDETQTVVTKDTAGTQENPIAISSADEFMKIYQNADLHYVLVSDIDLTGRSIPKWCVFKGSLDGQGHTISGMKIHIPGSEVFESERYFGLFSENHGLIKDLVLSDSHITSDQQNSGSWACIGILAGKNSGTIDSVVVSSSAIECKRPGSASGFISGINSGEIMNSKVTSGQIHSNGDVGAICGQNSGKLTSITVGNGKDEVFLSLWDVAVGYGTNGAGGRSMGSVCGYAATTSMISDLRVDRVFLQTYISGVDATSFVGRIIGWNLGRVLNTYSVGVIDDDLSLGPAAGISWYMKSDSHGYVGKNEGITPW